MTFKCKQCRGIQSYPSEKEAYQDGWFLEGMPLRGGVLPKGLTICYPCGSSPLPDSNVAMATDDE